MTMEIVKAVLIHIAVPILGLSVYLKLCYDIKKKSIPSPPFLQLFVLFFAFGGWFLIFLTFCFWYVSGMMILGFFFLLFVMPLVVIACIFSLYSKREVSGYHFYSLTACFAYLILAACIWLVTLSNNINSRA